MFATLEELVEKVSARQSWVSGWIAVRTTLICDEERMDDHSRKRLCVLEDKLRPRDLANLIRAYVCPPMPGAFEIFVSEGANSDSGSVRYQRVAEKARELGRSAAKDESILLAMLPEIFSYEGHGRIWNFGEGLAEGAILPEELWSQLVSMLGEMPNKDRDVHLLCGFLASLSKSSAESADRLLDNAMADPTLVPWFSVLQTSVEIDERGVDRLLSVISTGQSTTPRFPRLNLENAIQSVPPAKLHTLLVAISRMPDGLAVALDILCRYIDHSHETVPDELVACGQNLLEQATVSGFSASDDYPLSIIANSFLSSVTATSCAERVCTNFKSLLLNKKIQTLGYDRFLYSLFKVQPHLALTSFVAGDENDFTRLLIRESGSHRGRLSDVIPVDTMIGWAQQDPSTRFAELAEVVPLFCGSDDENCECVSVAAIAVLKSAPDKQAILSCYEDHFLPDVCWGSLAPILEKRREAILTLVENSDQQVSRWANEQASKLAQWAQNQHGTLDNDDGRFE